MNDLIRNSECVSCTITDVDKDGIAKIEFSGFRQARFPTSVIVLYEYNNTYYYPTTLEYRLIDNNVLYLIEELSVNSMEKVFQVLASSMEKEERWTNEFILCLVHLNKKPNYCHELKDFSIGDVKLIEVYE